MLTPRLSLNRRLPGNLMLCSRASEAASSFHIFQEPIKNQRHQVKCRTTGSGKDSYKAQPNECTIHTLRMLSEHAVVLVRLSFLCMWGIRFQRSARLAEILDSGKNDARSLEFACAGRQPLGVAGRGRDCLGSVKLHPQNQPLNDDSKGHQP